MAPEIWYLCPTLFTDNIACEQALFCLPTCDVLLDFTDIAFACQSPFTCSLGQHGPTCKIIVCEINHNITPKAGIFLYKIKQVRKPKNAGYQSNDNICITQL